MQYSELSRRGGPELGRDYSRGKPTAQGTGILRGAGHSTRASEFNENATRGFIQQTVETERLFVG